jgi:AmmeMemoRadiSam system protein B
MRHMVRNPVVAGQFYPANPHELRKQIQSCFLSKFGPGKEPSKEISKKLIGVISPHAGYMFSGPCQAFSYKEIAEAKLPDVYIIIGLSHSGYPTCISSQDWKTPLGTVKCDKEFQEVLSKHLDVNEDMHLSEHSIEVQLPFLQYATENSAIKIAPITASPDMDYREIADHIFNALQITKRTALIITSSDFTHYGDNYRYLPFTQKIKENMHALDKGALKQIEALNSASFLKYVNDTGATICGNYPIAVLLELSKRLGAKKGSLLQYYTSGDIVEDYSSAVGYASVKIE